MIVRYKPYFDDKELKRLFLTKKFSIKEFEKEFAKTVDAKYALTFPSGRSCLFSILESLNIKDKEIIMPGYNCIVVPSAVIASKNKPVFVDIKLEDFNINEEKISNFLSKDTNMIIPTHMYGNPVDIKKIREIIGEDVYIVEDAAQAILAKDVGKYSDAVFYSFNFEKQIFTFGGGIVTTNNLELFEKLKNFKNSYFRKNNYVADLKKVIMLFNTKIFFSDLFYEFFYMTWQKTGLKTWEKNHWDLLNDQLPVEQIYIKNDLESIYSNFQASIGISQLKKIKKNIQKRREIGKIYNKKLKGLDNISHTIYDPYSSYCHYTLRVKNRNYFEQYMKKRKILINKVFEYSVSDLPVFKPFVKKNQVLNNSLKASEENINLPIYPQLLDNKNKLDHIVNSVRDFDDNAL